LKAEILGDRSWANTYEDVEHSDLASLNRPADGWLANRVPITKLSLLFMVSRVKFLNQKKIERFCREQRLVLTHNDRETGSITTKNNTRYLSGQIREFRSL
jgi:hypothetical protein